MQKLTGKSLKNLTEFIKILPLKIIEFQAIHKIFTCQNLQLFNLSKFSPVKLLHCTVAVSKVCYKHLCNPSV